MKLKVFISSSRFAEQRAIAIKAVQSFCKMNNHEEAVFHDCNELDTGLLDSPQQKEYDRLITSETDVFIALLPSESIGMYTYHEIVLAYKNYISNSGFPLCFIFKAKEPQNFRSDSDRTIEELQRELKQISSSSDSEDFGHFFVDYENDNILAPKIIEQLALAYNRGRFFLRRFARLGQDIASSELLGERAKAENGFYENYFQRKYDKILSDNINSVVLIKGKSGSGKTRALYEFIVNGKLKNEKVIVVEDLNQFNAIYDILFTQDQYMRTRSSRVDVHNVFHIVIDEVDKLFSDNDIPRLKRMMECAYADDSICLYMTTTNDGYGKITDSYSDFFNREMCTIITIKPLDSTDKEDQVIIRKCKDFFSNNSNFVSDTIGGYNPSLNDGVKRVLKNIIKTEDSSIVFNDGQEIARNLLSFCMAYLVVKKYRRNSAEYLCMTLQQCYKLNGFSADTALELLNTLITAGIIRVFEEVASGDRVLVSSLRRSGFRFVERKYNFKGEDVSLIISPKYLFYFDDLIWDTLLGTRDLSEYTEDLQINDLLDCYGDDMKTYNKVLTRSDDKVLAWEIIYDLYERKALNISDPKYPIFVNFVIEYAPSFDRAKGIFEAVVSDSAHGYVANGDSLAVLISHIQREPNDKKRILDYVQAVREEHGIEPTIYYHLKSILTGTKTFSEVYSYIKNIEGMFDEVLQSHGKDSLQYANVLACYRNAIAKVADLNDLKQACEICINHPEITFKLFTFNKVIVNVKGDKVKLKEIFSYIFSDNGSLLSRLFSGETVKFASQYIIGCFVKNSDAFEDAFWYVKNNLHEELIESKILSQLSDKVSKIDKNFNLIVSFIEELTAKGKVFNVRVYNTLIKNAPNYMCVQSVVRLCKYKDIFTLNNALKILAEDYKVELRRMRAKSAISPTKYVNVLNKEIGLNLVNCKISNDSSSYNGVTIDVFTIIMLMEVNDRNITAWVRELLDRNPKVREMMETYYMYYSILIKNARALSEIQPVFEMYLQRCSKRGQLPNKPDVINSVGFRLRPDKVKHYDDRELYDSLCLWYKSLLVEYERVMDFDEYSMVNYFSLFHDEIFNADKSDLSDTFYSMMERYDIGQTVYPFSAISRNNSMELTFDQRKMIYEKYLKYCEEKRLPMKIHDLQLILGSLFHAVNTKAEADVCIEEYDRHNLPHNHIYHKNVKMLKYKLGIENEVISLSDACYSIVFTERESADSLLVQVGEFMVQHPDFNMDSRLSAKLFAKVGGLSDRTMQVRESLTIKVEAFIAKFGERIDIQLYGYNALLGFYYPELKKREIFNEIVSAGIIPDTLTYTCFIADWCCSIHTNREFFRLSEHVLDNERTLNSYLFQEVTEYLRNEGADYKYIYEVVCSIWEKKMNIERRVFDKIEKECAHTTVSGIADEYACFSSPKEFLLNHIGRKLDTEQYAKWSEIVEYFQNK